MLIGVTWLEPRAFLAAWLGTWLLIWILLGQRPKYAFRYGLLAGEACVWTGFFWLPATTMENLQVSVATGCLIAMLAVTWDAFRFGIFGYVAAVIRLRGAAAALVWPCVWVALEWLWPHVFPWRLGHSQSAWVEVIQIAEFSGAYGISFLMVWTATAAATLLQAWPARRSEAAPLSRPVLWHAAACVGAFACTLVWGDWRIQRLESDLGNCPQLTVALIQPGIAGGILKTCRGKTREVQTQAELICWPESSVGDYSLARTSFRSSDEVAAPSRGTLGPGPMVEIARPLLCAGGSFAPGATRQGPFFNTAFLIDDQENILGRYHKRALAPWGEYVVGQQWIPGLRELFCIRSEYRPGNSAAPLELPGRASLGVLICYEDLLEGHARQSVRAGAEVLVNLNNLAAFGRSPALWQHQQLAQFRAVETRRYLLRCGTVGSTAVISATGRVVAQATPHQAAALVHAVPLLGTQTLYTQWGDVLAVICVLATTILVMRSWRPSRAAGRSRCKPLRLGRETQPLGRDR